VKRFGLYVIGCLTVCVAECICVTVCVTVCVTDCVCVTVCITDSVCVAVDVTDCVTVCVIVDASQIAVQIFKGAWGGVTESL
jgi:hypothetical protein